MKSVDVFFTILAIILSLATPCITMVLIIFFDNVWFMQRMNAFWMTVTFEPVAVTFLWWLQPRSIYVPAIFGPQFSKIASRQSKNAHPANSLTRRHAPTLLHCTPLSPSAPFPSGVSISCSVSLPQPGGTVTSSSSSTTSPNGLRLCLPSWMMVVQQIYSSSTTS